MLHWEVARDQADEELNKLMISPDDHNKLVGAKEKKRNAEDNLNAARDNLAKMVVIEPDGNEVNMKEMERKLKSQFKNMRDNENLVASILIYVCYH